MTTPRVTVPVELVREKIAKLIDPEAFVPMEDVIGMRKAFVLADKIIAHTGYDGINWKAEWEDVCSLRIAERDTLSAAPAPEGGAADWQPIETALQNGTKIDLWGHWPEHDRWARTPDAVWDEERCDWKVNGFYAGQYAHPPRFTHWCAISGPAALATREEAPACKKCGGKGYTEHEGGEGEGYPSRPEIEACSCREEVPAEAGAAIEARFPELNDDLIRMASTGSTGSLTEWGAFVERLKSALRAQPPVREEAGCAEPEVGRAVYERIEKLMTDDPQGWERRYLSRLVESVEEVGSYEGPPVREDAQPVWVDGVPTKHHAKEWFIAETTFGDRVVLTALPEEYNYDFKTADETYIKADRIKKWMPFPDSQYLFPHPAPDALRVAVEALEGISHIRCEMVGVPVDSEAAWAWALALDAAADHATQALAALQAEQKGGA